MKTTGMIRRIDNLGRIVIPKEIRRVLKLKENEQMEIKVENDYIILHRYSELSQENSYLQTLLDTIYRVYDFAILITNLNSFCFTSYNYSHLKGKEISSFLGVLISERREISDSNSLYLTSKDILNNCYYYIKPIIKNGDILGLSIFLSKSNISDYKLLEFVLAYLDKYLD